VTFIPENSMEKLLFDKLEEISKDVIEIKTQLKPLLPNGQPGVLREMQDAIAANKLDIHDMKLTSSRSRKRWGLIQSGIASAMAALISGLIEWYHHGGK
jgi:hypothetical protein